MGPLLRKRLLVIRTTNLVLVRWIRSKLVTPPKHFGEYPYLVCAILTRTKLPFTIGIEGVETLGIATPLYRYGNISINRC